MSQKPVQTPFAILPISFDVPTITSVKRQSSFNYFGLVDASSLAAAIEYLTSHTDATKERASTFLNSFIEASQADCVGLADEKAACWLTIRLFHPSDEYRIPRWHQDGRMYTYDEGRESVVRSKYGITLLGPHTAILPAAPHIFDTMSNSELKFFTWRGKSGHRPTEEEIEQAQDEQRAHLAEQYKNEERVQLRQGQVIRFSWGRDDSPVHSEPDFVCDRVFMTVLYGSVPEIHRMCEFRGQEYGKSDIYYPRN
jgi:hypothetical protein